jgi:hypothetical protein
MKNKSFVALFLTTTLSLFTASLHATVGCMDNSYHLEKDYDYKQYHFVECNCPCKAKRTRHNKCAECLHFHMPSNWHFVSASSYTPTTLDEKKPINTTHSFASSDTVLKMLVKKYRGDNHE